jgi:hypothetical protein
MRTALLLAAGCCLFVSQPGVAGNVAATIYLSKPNTSFAAFQSDRNDCYNAASHSGFYSPKMLARDNMAGSASSPTAIRYNYDEFSACMSGKGYKLDPNGFKAAKAHLDQDGHIVWLTPSV